MPNKPGIINRAKLALDVFRNGLPWKRYAEIERKQSPLAWPTFVDGEPQWQIVDYASYVNEGFNLNSLIYSAIMFKARASSSAPLRAYGGDMDHPEILDAKHPLSKLLARPNPWMSGTELEALNRVYFNLAGNCYTFMDRPKRGGLPTQMISLRPDRVYIIPANQGIKGYLYVPEGKAIKDGVPILSEDMMHVKLPNPGDPLEGMGYGLSPISPIAYSADVDNSVTKYLKLFFERGTMTGVLLKFEQALDDPTIAKIKERWMQQYGGYENWADVGVLHSKGEVQQLGMTFKDMGFGEIDERNESRILGPLGVPPILLGTRMGLLRGTYSNYEQARQAFWQDTFVPELGFFEVEYQYYLKSDDGAFPKYDLSGVPALQVDKTKLVDAAFKLWSMGVPANQATETVGLETGDIPGGDIGYISGTVIQVGPEAPQGPDTNQGAASAEEDNRQEGGGQKSGMRPFPIKP